MTVPITPADLEWLRAMHARAEDPCLTFPHHLILREALYDHAGALLDAARERDALRVELEAHKGAANKLRSCLAAEVRRLRAELAEARAALRGIEWLKELTGIFCPDCANTKEQGHAPDCNLAAALGEGKS